eukprot:8526776-Pyramimonas_sp.AAC.3
MSTATVMSIPVLRSWMSASRAAPPVLAPHASARRADHAPRSRRQRPELFPQPPAPRSRATRYPLEVHRVLPSPPPPRRAKQRW